MQIDFWSSGDLVTRKRTYEKIFNVVGELGGFIEIVMMTLGFLYALSRLSNYNEHILTALTDQLFAENPEAS